MRTRTVVSIAVATLLIAVTGMTALAAVDQYRARPLDRQNIGHIALHRQTTSTDWAQIGGWSFSDGMAIAARGGVATTLSVTVSGAPIEYRVVMEIVEQEYAQRSMKPAFARFDPGAGTESFSYTFVSPVGPGRYTINLLWRSPTGELVEMHSGSLVVQYGAR